MSLRLIASYTTGYSRTESKCKVQRAAHSCSEYESKTKCSQLFIHELKAELESNRQSAACCSFMNRELNMSLRQKVRRGAYSCTESNR